MKHTTTRPTQRAVATVITGVVALAALVLGAGAAGAAPTQPQGKTGWIRAGHLSPGTPKADVRLTPYTGGAPTTLSDVSFGEITSYSRVPVGLYTIALLPAGNGGDTSAAPMISRNVQVREGAASTVIATGAKGQVRASVLDDDLEAPPAGQAKVRLVSAATSPTDGVTAQVVGGPVLAREVTTGSSTGYATVAAQTWSVELSADFGSGGAGSVTNRVPVRAGGIYTLVALDDAQGQLRLRAVKDAASSTSTGGAMPTGGVATGGGGMAGRTGSPDLGVASLAGALSVFAAGLLVARRRHLRGAR